MNLKPVLTPAIKAAGAAIGFAAGGPLGLHIGSWLGGAVLGQVGSKVVLDLATKFGEKYFEASADPLLEALKKEKSHGLEQAYRDALRMSLADMPAGVKDDPENEGWFENWERCLKGDVPLRIDQDFPEQLTPEVLDGLFVDALQTLDAQGRLIERMNAGTISVVLPKVRELPAALLVELGEKLPGLLREALPKLLVTSAYGEAYREVVLRVALDTKGDIRDALARLDRVLGGIGEIKQDTAAILDDTAAIRKMLEGYRDAAIQDGRVKDELLQARDAEITRLTEDYRKLQEQLNARSSEPAEAALSELLAAGNVGDAIRLKTKQIEVRRSEADKLPRDYFELGTLHELHFDWPAAYEAFRKAWELEKNPEFGFKFAFFADRQRQFREAITTYEALLELEKDSTERSHLLNNLAILYRATQRLKEAEGAYVEALATYRKLAEINLEAYLPDVAMTLNNLGLLYGATQRMKEAEGAYVEALATCRKLADTNPEAYLPYVAGTLNNLAVLYDVTQRMKEAEGAYVEALAIRRKLADINPEAYLPYVAGTLNNLAVLYDVTQRMKEAEGAYGEALATYRKLAETNPEAYLPDVAATLNNLAILYRATQRMKEAEGAYGEALATYRKLAETNPEAYLPDVAATLNNLAILYRATQRMKEAEGAYGEALAIRRKLADISPEAYLPDVAMTLNNLANLYGDTQRMKEAEGAYGEALAIRRKLAETNPEANLPDVAMTLNNLAYSLQQIERPQEAEVAVGEAEGLLEPLWRANPEVHGDLMAKILWTRVLVGEDLGWGRDVMCDLARRGFAAAYNPGTKAGLQELMDRHCGEAAGSV